MSAAVLLLIFTTAATLLGLAALLLRSGSGVLKGVLLALTLAPLLYGWWSWGRSRRQGGVIPTGVYAAVLGVPAAQSLSRLSLDWSGGRPLDAFDVASLVLLVAGLVGLMVFRSQRGRRKQRG